MAVTPKEVKKVVDEKERMSKTTKDGITREDILHGIEKDIDTLLLEGFSCITISIRELYELEGLTRPAPKGKRGNIDEDLEAIMDKYRAVGWSVATYSGSDDFYDMTETYTFIPNKK